MSATTTRHQCLIYGGSPAKHLPGLASVIVSKLNANHRCLYLNSPPMVAGIRSYLAAAGLNVQHAIQKGALVLSSDQNHLKEGRFDADRMLHMLEEAVTQALKSGYEGLWASGDMSWEMGPRADFGGLLHYERGLEELFARRPCLSGICQYHQDTLPAEAIVQAVYGHRSIYVNQTLSRLNPYFVPPGTPEGRTAQLSAGSVRDVVQILNREL